MVDDEVAGGAAAVSPNNRWKSRRWVVGALIMAAVLGGAALVGSQTHWFGLRPDPRQTIAIDRCESAVRRDLAAPSQASFDGIGARADIVTEDDHIAFGFEASKIVSVWAVHGSVASPARSGQMAALRFTCRAVFFDGRPVVTVVNYGSADLPGQLAQHP